MKQHAPPSLRNREPIAEVLARELPPRGNVLEIASGTGEHAVFFAERFPELRWQPTDPSPEALASVAAWREDYAGTNLAAPLMLDAAAPEGWPGGEAAANLCINMGTDSFYLSKTKVYSKYNACVCINMLHISEWEATVGLFKGCAHVLTRQAPIILYGPYLEEGVETASSNLAFDQSLKARHPAWGLRELSDVDRVAAEWGFERTSRYDMPANNLTLIYRKRSS